MTWVLVRKLLRDLRVSLFVIVVLLAGFEALWVKVTERVTTQIAPLFQGLATKFFMPRTFFQDQLFGGPGKFFQTILGGEQTRFDRAQDMLCVGYLHPFVLIVFSIWAIGRAAGAIAGEIDRGTMELLLAQPLARTKLIVSHLFVDLIVIPILCVAMFIGSTAGVAWLAPFVVDTTALDKLGIAPQQWEGLGVSAWVILPGLLNVGALIFAMSGITIWLSACGRFRWRVVGFAIVVMLLQFATNVLGQLWSGIAFLRPFTVFYYYQPQKIMLNGQWTVELGDVWNGGEPLFAVNVIVMLLGIGLMGYFMAWRTFVRRDVPAPL